MKQYQGKCSLKFLDNKLKIKNNGDLLLEFYKENKNSKYISYSVKNGYQPNEIYQSKINLEGGHFVFIPKEQLHIKNDENMAETSMRLDINLTKQSIVEYFTDNLFIDGNYNYKQLTNIEISPLSSLVYLVGITTNNKKLEQKIKLHTRISSGEKIILNDVISTNENEYNDLKRLGVFAKYLNFNSLIVINPKIDTEYINHLNAILSQIEIKGKYDINKLNVPGFIIRVLTKENNDLIQVLNKCLKSIREELFQK